MVDNHLLKNNQLLCHVLKFVFDAIDKDTWNIINGDKSNFDHII